MTDHDWQVYIVECSDRSLYTGITVDVSARIAQHNSGSGAKYTRGRLPVKLVYSECADDRGSALRREHEIKRLTAVGKRKLVSGPG